jgi:microcystin degradation protein MlrC
LPEYDDRPGIWDANLMIGYVWADEPRATACAVVTATDKQAAAIVAAEIANAYWSARPSFSFGPVTEPLDTILDIAETIKTGPIILADSGDNPTGGGVGDRADVLAELIKRDWQGALLGGITDRPAVAACFSAGEGAVLSLKIGGSLDPQSPSVQVSATVLKLDDHGATDERQAVVEIGGITVVLAARRRPYHMIADFTRLGFDPLKVRLLVVKSGYLSPELAPIANPNLMALSNGVINQDIASLPNLRRTGDIYPFVADFKYEPKPQASLRWV